MTDLRKTARGRACLIRLPEICNHDPETTVLCHYRLAGISGLGFKSPDIFGAFGCSSCHAAVDSCRAAEYRLALAEGVMRTQAIWLKEGLIKA